MPTDSVSHEQPLLSAVKELLNKHLTDIVSLTTYDNTQLAARCGCEQIDLDHEADPIERLTTIVRDAAAENSGRAARRFFLRGNLDLIERITRLIDPHYVSSFGWTRSMHHAVSFSYQGTGGYRNNIEAVHCEFDVTLKLY